MICACVYRLSKKPESGELRKRASRWGHKMGITFVRQHADISLGERERDRETDREKERTKRYDE